MTVALLVLVNRFSTFFLIVLRFSPKLKVMLKPLGVFVPPDVLLQREVVQLGDLLEIDRKLYSHWAVFVGNSEVVHLPESRQGSALVARCSLQAVAQDGRVRGNNKQLAARERELTEFPDAEVVKRALDSVGTRVPYNIVTSNGEHFVTKLKYGVGWSDQARVMQASMSSLSQSQTNPIEMRRVHLDLFSEIQHILSTSPPVNGPLSPPLHSHNPPSFLSASLPQPDNNNDPSSPAFTVSQNSPAFPLTDTS